MSDRRLRIYAERIAQCQHAEIRELATNMLQFQDQEFGIRAVRDAITLLEHKMFDDEPFRWLQRAVGDSRKHWSDKSWQARVREATILAEEALALEVVFSR